MRMNFVGFNRFPIGYAFTLIEKSTESFEWLHSTISFEKKYFDQYFEFCEDSCEC